MAPVINLTPKYPADLFTGLLISKENMILFSEGLLTWIKRGEAPRIAGQARVQGRPLRWVLWGEVLWMTLDTAPEGSPKRTRLYRFVPANDAELQTLPVLDDVNMFFLAPERVYVYCRKSRQVQVLTHELARVGDVIVRELEGEAPRVRFMAVEASRLNLHLINGADESVDISNPAQPRYLGMRQAPKENHQVRTSAEYPPATKAGIPRRIADSLSHHTQKTRLESYWISFYYREGVVGLHSRLSFYLDRPGEECQLTPTGLQECFEDDNRRVFVVCASGVVESCCVAEIDVSDPSLLRLVKMINVGDAINLKNRDHHYESLAEALREPEDVRSLDLSHSNFTVYPDAETGLSAVFGFSRLEELNLGNCKLVELPDRFDELPALRRIDFEFSNLSGTLPESITRLENLEFLNIRGNAIDALPDSIGRLKRLEVLQAGSNRIKTLPASFGQLSALCEVDLSGNGLPGLPEDLSGLQGLKAFYLLCNKLQCLPRSIGDLGALEILNVRENELLDLPETLGDLTGLIDLNLELNRIDRLPDSLGRLSRLRTLIMSNNALMSLPDELCKLPSLQKLALQRNQLTAIPEGLFEMPALEEVFLAHNQLTRLPSMLRSPEGATRLNRLKLLSLWENRLRHLPADLDALAQLSSLRLSGNQLEDLPDALSRMQQLEYIDVSDNRLTRIPDLSALKHLSSLDLNSNALQALDKSNGLPSSLERLNIVNNPLPEGSARRLRTELPDCLVLSDDGDGDE